MMIPQVQDDIKQISPLKPFQAVLQDEPQQPDHHRHIDEIQAVEQAVS